METIWQRLGRVIGKVGIVIVGIFIAAGIGFGGYVVWLLIQEDTHGEPLPQDFSLSGCDVLAIRIHGCMLTYAPQTDTLEPGCDAYSYSDEISGAIRQANRDDGVKALLLDIDSPGGVVTAGEEVSTAIAAFGKPSIAWIRGSGDSAAYWAASAAKKVIAYRSSDVGSIGVTSSYVDLAEQNADQGVTYNVLSTGKYKDLGSPEKALTKDERDLIEQNLRVIYEQFVEDVAKHRSLPLESVRALADGSSVPGEVALKDGLIDKVGTWTDVEAELAASAGEDPRICWY